LPFFAGAGRTRRQYEKRRSCTCRCSSRDFECSSWLALPATEASIRIARLTLPYNVAQTVIIQILAGIDRLLLTLHSVLRRTALKGMMLPATLRVWKAVLPGERAGGSLRLPAHEPFLLNFG